MTLYTTKTETGDDLEINPEQIVAIKHILKPGADYYEIYLTGGQLFFLKTASAEAIIERMKR